jgi:hypothetical protein
LLEVRKCATKKYATLSDAHSTEAVKDSSVSSGINRSKHFERTWKVVKEAAARKSKHPNPHFFNKMLKNCGIFFVLGRLNGQPGLLGRNIDEFT